MKTLLAIAVSGLMFLAPAQSEDTPPATVYLVRHAEKMKEGRDPALTEAGHARSRALVDALRAAGIEHVHSTNYTRTRDTAAPMAKALETEVEQYDPRDLRGLAQRIRAAGGRHLVVGHSNTTHSAVRAFGGEAGPPIDEPTEYDRIYVLEIEPDGTVRTAMLRYGAASGS